MGQPNSKFIEYDYKKIMENYTTKRKIIDYLYGEGILLEDKTTNRMEVFMKEFVTMSKLECDKMMESLNQRMKIKSPNIIELLAFALKNENHMCSENYKIYVFMEYCSKSLDSEINERKNEMKKFTNGELWYILESYILGLSILQSHSYFCSDIKPSSLFQSKSGLYKVIESNLVGNKSNFINILEDIKKNKDIYYLSPALLEAIGKKNYKPIHNIFKSDVFSLGISLIHIALLSDCKDIYDFDEFKINQQIIDKKLDQMRNEDYSQHFINLVRKMVSIDEKERPDFNQLDDYLKSKIEKKIPFQNRRLTGGSFSINDIDFQNKKFLKKEFTENSFQPLTEHIGSKNILASDTFVQSNKDLKNYEPNSARQLLKKKMNESYNKNLLKTVKVETNKLATIEDYLYDKIDSSNEDDDENINDILQKYGIEPLKQINFNLEMNNNTNTRNNPKENINNKNYKIKTPIKQEIIDKKEESLINHLISNKVESPIKIENNNENDVKTQNKYENKSESKVIYREKEIISIPNDNLNKIPIITEYYFNGSKYEGQKQNGLKNGKGIFYYSNGMVLDAQWKNNKIEGIGILKNSENKIIYQGEWKNDKFHGKGCLFNEKIDFKAQIQNFNFKNFNLLDNQWIKFEGNFENDLKNGFGNIYLVNGEKFSGNFNNDLVDGKGCFYKIDGNVIHGIWKENLYLEL